MIDHYDWAGGREAMMRFGSTDGPVVVAALPLLEEANRTRTFVVGLLRALAARGIASVLPDVPGQGESLTPLADLTLADLAEALAAVGDRLGGRATVALGVRSGALLDARARHRGRWHLSPVTGAEMRRDLDRIRQASQPRDGIEDAVIAGNTLSPRFLSSLTEPLGGPHAPTRIVRLSSDPRPADRKVDGAPLWRRAEPDDDAALANVLADDIATWLPTCVG